MKAFSGIALAPTEAVVVLGVVPDVTPEVRDEPVVDVAPCRTVAGLLSTVEEGVYFTDVVSAFEPAAAEAEDENDVEAPAPVAPDEAFDWIYNEPRLLGCCCHSGAVSRTTWYWFSCVYSVLICRWPYAS